MQADENRILLRVGDRGTLIERGIYVCDARHHHIESGRPKRGADFPRQIHHNVLLREAGRAARTGIRATMARIDYDGVERLHGGLLRGRGLRWGRRLLGIRISILRRRSLVIFNRRFLRRWILWALRTGLLLRIHASLRGKKSAQDENPKQEPCFHAQENIRNASERLRL